MSEAESFRILEKVSSPDQVSTRVVLFGFFTDQVFPYILWMHTGPKGAVFLGENLKVTLWSRPLLPSGRLC